MFAWHDRHHVTAPTAPRAVGAPARFLLAAVLALGVAFGFATTASAASSPAAQNAVGASSLAAAPLVGLSEDVSPATHLETYDSQAQIVSATGVATDTAGSDLSAFGNRAGPRLPRPTDMEIGQDGMLVPQGPPSPVGASTFADPAQAPLSGHYWTIPEGTSMPQGMGVLRDGVDVGGLQPATHATIYATEPMAPATFIQRVLDLPWEYGGKK